ncbi:LPS export ABC transporter periplasmic protein LptC [Xanthomonas theicola]|uniref:Lipopolysaccharide export system protein LptC n=1 Tax=Xanthomonas theicola TaxID=56464 RepID=A0A2S6ZKD0_9XANT|nr:LPS export ABC transporter periplasmic protein LptC [Xanthomonas theicola]PPT92724.1 LPS export ABC transporter periplasmic protein LptC [Xanthomonas theicola]QNH24357.1 LPS export ABC transporter periplasmic protein LptC [Xanthomonas theicola]
MNWRTCLGGLLLVAAVISGWSAWHQRSKPVRAATEEARADYVAHDFEIVTLDKQGKESMTLRAPQMERARADQTMAIVSPLFLLPDANGQRWEMRSKTGWVSASGDELRLRGDVAGDSPKVPSIPPTTFRTQSLDVFPQTSTARTAEPVTMTRPGMMQSGVGFEVDLKSRQYKLLSQVKTRYEPNAAR